MINDLIEFIGDIAKKKNENLVISIDGNAGSGKTTTAKKISEFIDCNVFHTDNFFLPPNLRTSKRLTEIGGNVDYERIKIDLIDNIKSNKDFTFTKYNCNSNDYTNVDITSKKINILEGSYSIHKFFRKDIDGLIFLTTTYDNQIERIIDRGQGNSIEMFKNVWIPLEQKYFDSIEFYQFDNFICFET